MMFRISHRDPGTLNMCHVSADNSPMNEKAEVINVEKNAKNLETRDDDQRPIP